MHGRHQKFLQICSRKIYDRRENDIKMDLKGIGREGVD
jgi:hypothetical protein